MSEYREATEEEVADWLAGYRELDAIETDHGLMVKE